MNILCLALLLLCMDDSAGSALNFREELRFGGGEEDHELWVDGARTCFFQITNDGQFLIVDTKNSVIQLFDQKGEFISTFAKKGQGPGEFQNINTINVLADGTVVAQDFIQVVSRFNYFTPELKYRDVKTINSTKNLFFTVDYAPNGEHFFSNYLSINMDTGDMKFKAGVFNGAFEPVKELGEADFPPPTQTIPQSSDDWAKMISKQLDGIINRNLIKATYMPGGQMLMADGRKYEVQLCDADGSNCRKILTHRYKPVAFSEEEKGALATWLAETVFEQFPQASNVANEATMMKAVEMSDLPKTKNPIEAMIPLDERRFLVVHQANYAGGTVAGQIFDLDGKFLGDWAFPHEGVFDLFGIRLKFQDGKAYAMIKNDMEDNVMVRYAVQ